MSAINLKADAFFTEGCGRCPLGGTPQCKVHNWEEELAALRALVLDCGLTEERKWGVPCYTVEKRNVLLISALKENCVLSFFKGALLTDPHGILEKPGENTQAGRVIRFTKARDIVGMESILRAFIQEAVEIEKSGRKVDLKKIEEHTVPEEFQRRLDSDPALNTAFRALTPGRQRAYLIHFSAPRQSKTREARIDKCLPQILDGKGLNDR